MYLTQGTGTGMTFQLITSAISLNPKLIHVIMPTCIFITITNNLCTYAHIQLMSLPKKEHLITATFFLIYHRLSNPKYSYVGNSQEMSSPIMVLIRVFLWTYYARYVMDPSIIKQCTLASFFFGKALGLHIPY